MMRNFDNVKVELFIDGLITILRGVTVYTFRFDQLVMVRKRCNEDELLSTGNGTYSFVFSLNSGGGRMELSTILELSRDEACS
jgi:hypothetical protein